MQGLEKYRDIEVVSPDDDEFDFAEAWLPTEDDSVNYVEPEEIAVAPKPTGEGLSKRQAHSLLIAEMNKIKQVKNTASLLWFRTAIENWARFGGEKPMEPVYTPVFSERAINHAVQMARHIGGYEELLKNCGF